MQKFIKWISYPVRKVIPLMQNIHYIYIGMWAIVGIVVLILLLLLLLYLVYRLNPRLPWINHSINLESYMDDVYDNLNRTLTVIRGGLRDMPKSEAFQNMPTRVDQLRDQAYRLLSDLYNKHGDENVTTGIKLYFAFGDAIEKLSDDPGSRSMIRGNAEHLFVNDTTGEISAKKVNKFKQDFITPLNNIRTTLVELSVAMHQWGDDMRWNDDREKGWTIDDAYLVTCIHETRLMLEDDHVEKIRRMMATRQNVSPVAIWTLYYWPEAKTLLTKRIPNLWRKVPVEFPRRMQQFFDWWGRIGVLFATLPCYSAYSDPAERHKRCKTGADLFTQQEDAAELDEVEAFGLGGIVNALKSIGTFFINIAAMGIAVGKLFATFPVDPFGTIIGLLSIVIGTIVGFQLMLIHLLLTVTGSFFILAFLWAFIVVITYASLMTLILFLFAILIALPYFGLWLVDLPTRGMVVRLMRCESDPSDWYQNNSYAKDNVYSRIVPFCLRPCANRYRPTLGCCCTPLPKHVPDKCPQQHVYALYKRKTLGDVKGPVTMARYDPPASFKAKTIDSKRNTLLGVYNDKIGMYGECYKQLGNKDFITQHLCRFVDILELSEKDRKVMATLCNECMCKFKPDGFRAEGTPEGYRKDLKNKRACELVKDANDDGSTDQLSTDLFRRVLVMLIFLVSVLVVVFALVKSGKQLTM